MSTVLVVDDSPILRERTSNLLKANGLTVIQAHDGVEALDRIQTRPLDLAILDIAMPRLNGYEVCRLIKANPHTWNMPVIFVSTKGESLDRYWGLKQGADECIFSPWYPKELVKIVKELLQKNRIKRDRPSADDWIKYGSLVLSTIGTQYEVGCTYFYDRYDRALSAFEEALKLDSHHSLAQMYRSALLPTVEARRRVVEARRRQAIHFIQLPPKTCQGCRYYHGAHGLICAVHPDGAAEEVCLDWESE